MSKEAVVMVIFGATILAAAAWLSWITIKTRRDVTKENEEFGVIKAKIESDDPEIQKQGWKEAADWLAGHAKEDPRMHTVVRDYFMKQRLKNERPAN